MISTRNSELIPDVAQLKRLSQSLAMLDAIIEPEWAMRYYSFDSHWAKGQQAAFMWDGSGGDYAILFDDDSRTLIKGFAHECPMSPYRVTPPTLWPGVTDDVPLAFDGFWSEPAFASQDATFCLWRTHQDAGWQRGTIEFPDADDPDGSAALLAMLDGRPETYLKFAQEYYEREFDLSAIAAVYRHQPLTENLLQSLNENLKLADVLEEAKQIGYPTEIAG